MSRKADKSIVYINTAKDNPLIKVVKVDSGIFIYNGANRKEMNQCVYIPLDAYKALKDILDSTR